MPTFRYRATTQDQMTKQGEVESASLDEAIRTLQEQGLELHSIELVSQQTPSPKFSEQATLSQDDFLEVGKQIARLAKSGMPLESGLEALAEEVPRGRIRNGLLAIVNDLRAGRELETALANQQAPPTLLVVIRAGVQSGHLGLVLSQYLEHVRQLGRMRQRLALAFGYPLLLITMCTAICLLFLCLLVPDMANLYDDYGMELPTLTQMQIGMSRTIRDYGWFLLGGAILLAGGVWLVLQHGVSPATRRRWLFRVPLLGGMVRAGSLSRFFRLLSLLIEKAFPLADALALAGLGSGDPEISRSARNLAVKLRKGETIVPSREDNLFLSASLIELLTSRHPQSALVEIVRTLSMTYENQASARSTVLVMIAEPVIVLFTACMVGFWILNLLFPMIKLLHNLS